MFKTRLASVLWALALIGAGALLLLQNLGLAGTMSALAWVGFLTLMSVLFFAAYIANGWRNWGWLFPATVFGGLAATAALATLVPGDVGAVVGAPLFAGIAAPFIVAYFVDRPRNTWALIPAWVMVALTLLMLVVDRAPDSLVPAVVMFAIAIPFLVVYLRNRAHWWALIPAFVLAVIGVIPILSEAAPEAFMGAFVLWMIALPFFVVYFVAPKNWWALIPAGIMTSIGLTALLSGAAEPNEGQAGIFAAVMLAGFALTFLALWLRRATTPTAWAVYPAALLGIGAVGALFFGVKSQNYLMPALIILAGIAVLYYSLRPKAHQ